MIGFRFIKTYDAQSKLRNVSQCQSTLAYLTFDSSLLLTVCLEMWQDDFFVHNKGRRSCFYSKKAAFLSFPFILCKHTYIHYIEIEAKKPFFLFFLLSSVYIHPSQTFKLSKFTQLSKHDFHIGHFKSKFYWNNHILKCQKYHYRYIDISIS